MQEPSPRSRITSLESRTTKLEANIIEIDQASKQDMQHGFRQLKEDIKDGDQRLFEHVQAGFQQANALLRETASKEDIKTLATKEELAEVRQDVARVEGKLDVVLMLLKKGGSKEV